MHCYAINTILAENWKTKISNVLSKANAQGHEVVTAAEYSGQENTFLEAKRKQLFDNYPISDEFKQWINTLEAKTITKPPI